MFSGCKTLETIDVSKFDTSNVTNMYEMFRDCRKLKTLHVTGFMTGNVTNMSCMFAFCESLTLLDVTHFDTSNVTTMASLFSGCSALKTLNLLKFDTSSVSTMEQMFQDCTSLTELDLSNFAVANLQYANEMFGGCSNLKTIYVLRGSDWSTDSKVPTANGGDNGVDMFDGCSNLTGGNGTKYSYANDSIEAARIDSDMDPALFTQTPFYMRIEDVFDITGKGIVVTGTINRGEIRKGNTVQLSGGGKSPRTLTCQGIEQYNKTIDYANYTTGNIGIILGTSISKDDVTRGMILSDPDSVKLYTKFKATIYVLSKEEGGRHTPFFDNYKPMFYIGVNDIAGTITLLDGKAMVSPGESATISVELTGATLLEVGTTFSIRESGKTIGTGTVTELLE
ncbi:MAG: BspA family leucine-rich repeat surface protein [Treponema sp.]|nr:BspA family leucine-rich repeat surface protein [Treponema sp.]